MSVRALPAFAATETDAVADWPTTAPPCLQVHDPTDAPVQAADNVTTPPPWGRLDGLALTEQKGAATGGGADPPAWVTETFDVVHFDASCAAHAVNWKVSVRAMLFGFDKTETAVVAEMPTTEPFHFQVAVPTVDPVQAAASITMPPEAARLAGFASALHDGAVTGPGGGGAPTDAWVTVSETVTHCAGTSLLQASAESLNVRVTPDVLALPMRR